MIKKEFTKIFENAATESARDIDLVGFSKNILTKQKSNLPKLFRYSPADYYNIRSLETETLFLSPIGNMNDIFEGLSCRIDDNVINQIEKMQDIAYLKSFSENKNHLLMWAHYANNYTGMCVEYDLSNLSEEVLYHLYPIHYSKIRFPNKDLSKVIEEHSDLKRMNEDYCYPNECDHIKDIKGSCLKMWFSIYSYVKPL